MWEDVREEGLLGIAGFGGTPGLAPGTRVKLEIVYYSIKIKLPGLCPGRGLAAGTGEDWPELSDSFLLNELPPLARA